MSLDPGDCILVFAHPDDEVLWASALLARARAVILCFGDMHKPAVSEGRRRALAAYPLPNVESLAIPEAGVFERAAWPDPPPAPDGLALRADLPAQEADRPRRYGANFARLTELLRPRLTGARTVVTHNPWGNTATRNMSSCSARSRRCSASSASPSGSPAMSARNPNP